LLVQVHICEKFRAELLSHWLEYNKESVVGVMLRKTGEANMIPGVGEKIGLSKPKVRIDVMTSKP
jgi:hypothetical protein